MPKSRSKRHQSDDGIGRSIGGAVDDAIGLALDTASRLMRSALPLPGADEASDRRRAPPPGARPGLESIGDVDTPPAPGAVQISGIDYGPQRVEAYTAKDVDDLLSRPRGDWCRVRWISVDGLHPYVVNRLKQHYAFHTLAAEDVLNVPQRPKLEVDEAYLFAVARMLRLQRHELQSQQVSMFLYADTLITFQEQRTDMWQPIRDRIRIDQSRVRTNDASYLLYTLFDAIVDHGFPILERYGDTLERMEQLVMRRTTSQLLHRLHSIKRQLSLLRRVMWPMRELIDQLHRNEDERLSDPAPAYFRDVYDHAS